MADHGQKTFPGPSAMHVAIPPPHWAESGAEIGAHGIEHWFAESQPSGSVANERGKNIPLAQGQSQGNAQRLLAAAEENAALNFARAVEAGHFLIQHPGQEHEAKGPQIVRWKGRRPLLRSAAFQSL